MSRQAMMQVTGEGSTPNHAVENMHKKVEFFFQNGGWEILTDAVIQVVSRHREGMTYMESGKPAYEYTATITITKHFHWEEQHAVS